MRMGARMIIGIARNIDLKEEQWSFLLLKDGIRPQFCYQTGTIYSEI